MAEKLQPQTAHDHIQGQQALLVCGYDSDEKFQNNHLEGAMSLKEFQSIKDSQSKDREIIFYCA